MILNWSHEEKAVGDSPKVQRAFKFCKLAVSKHARWLKIYPKPDYVSAIQPLTEVLMRTMVLTMRETNNYDGQILLSLNGLNPEDFTTLKERVNLVLSNPWFGTRLQRFFQKKILRLL